jgi:hypothetical protein
MKATFNMVDKVGELTVFNIGGNKYRLIAYVRFKKQIAHMTACRAISERDRVHQSRSGTSGRLNSTPHRQHITRCSNIMDAQNTGAALCRQQGGGEAGGQSILDRVTGNRAEHGFA